MGRFLDAAHKVLQLKGRPLSAAEIAGAAVAMGLLTTSGKTPAQTMKSKLSTDIRLRGEKSVFMRSSPGRFGLRQWKDRLPEYQAQRYVKALLDEDVVVFPQTSLARYVPHTGLQREPIDSQGLLSECFPMQRRVAEEDPRVIQLVSVFVLRHKDRYLTYKRSKRLPEARLHDEYSLAFGGHLNPEDASPLLDVFVPELGLALLMRELWEEVRLPKDHPPELSYKGLIYDDSRDLSRQHLGIVYDVSLQSPEYEIGERGFLIDPRFERTEEILGRLEDFENWSVLLLESDLAEAKGHRS